GPGRESPVAGCKGVRPSPCSMGPGRAEVSLRRAATAITLRSAGTGSMPVSAPPRPADQSLGDNAPQRADEPRDCTGGSAGDVKSPRKVWRGITAHTLY